MQTPGAVKSGPRFCETPRQGSVPIAKNRDSRVISAVFYYESELVR